MNNIKKEIEKMIGDTAKAKENTWNKITKTPTKKLPLTVMVSSTVLICFILVFLYSSKLDGFNQPPNDILKNSQHEGMQVPFKLYEEKKDLPNYINGQDSVILIKNEATYSYYYDLFQFQITGREIDFSQSDMLIITFETNSCGLEAKEFVQKEGELQLKLDLPANLKNKHFIACDDLSVPNAQMYIINKIDVQHGKIIKEEKEIVVPLNELEIQQKKYDFEMFYTNDVAKATLTSSSYTSPNLTNKQTLQEMKQIILQAIEQPGIANTASPDYRITFEDTEEKSFSVFLWIGEEDETALISSSRNTHTIYTLPKEMAIQLLTLSGMKDFE